MIIEASIPGLFRTILLIIGGFVLLRFIGQLLNAKRNLDKQRLDEEQRAAYQKEKSRQENSIGKTKIVKPGKYDAEDVDYEELDT